MNPDPRPSADAGYSPKISAELLLHDQSFAVAALGPGQVVIQSPRPLPPGRGTIYMRIDGQLTVYHAELPSGINPSHPAQPAVILAATAKESAA